jgi:MFS family permease
MNLPRNVLIATLASLLTDVSSEMIVYLIPMFLSGVLQTPVAFIGLVKGIAETTTSFSKLASGYLSDRFQNRKRLVVLGYGLSTVVKGFLSVANTWSAVFAVRTLVRLGKDIRTAPRDALIADSVSETQRGAAFGFHRAGDTLGAFIGVGLAMLVVYLSQQSTLSAETFRTVVLLSIIPAALAVMTLVVGIREPRALRPAAPVSKDKTRTSFHLRHLDKRFRFLLVVVALFTLGNSADAFIVLRAQERGASVLTVLAMVLTFNFVYTVAAQPLGNLSDKLGRNKVISVGWFLYAFVYLGLALAQTLWQVWVLWALYGLYYAFTEGALKALVADLVPKEQRGSAYGWLSGTTGLMALPASLIAGLLWQYVSPSAPFLLGATLGVGAATLFLKSSLRSIVLS